MEQCNSFQAAAPIKKKGSGDTTINVFDNIRVSIFVSKKQQNGWRLTTSFADTSLRKGHIVLTADQTFKFPQRCRAIFYDKGIRVLDAMSHCFKNENNVSACICQQLGNSPLLTYSVFPPIQRCKHCGTGL